MASSTASFRRVVATSAVSLAIAVSPIFTAIAQAVSLTGAGATFPVPLYERYIRAFQSKNPGIKVSYQGVGSGAGIRQMIAGVIDFGGSDAAMTDAEMAKVGRGVILVPTAGGAVAVVYNLPGVSNLRLSSKTLPAIFSGKITRWNDPRIAADNPGLNLPNAPIRTVVRADSSGTTFIFSNHLSAVDPYFKGRVGTGTAPRWATNPIKGRGNPGVAAQVKNTPNSIGYVEFSYAKQNNLQTAAVQNKRSGEYVKPSLQSANAALSQVKFPDNFRVFEGNPATGYPIVGLTWMMVYKQYPTQEQANAVKKWINWVLTDGQSLNDDLDYTRIPSGVAQRAQSVVNSQVTVGGSK